MKIITYIYWFMVIVLIFAIILKFTTGLDYEFLGQIKPITMIQYLGFLVFALTINKYKEPLYTLLKGNIDLSIILVLFVIMASTFEMMWAFGYWFSTYNLKVIEGLPDNSNTLDTLVYTPTENSRWFYQYSNKSLNTSAKMTTMLFMMAIYSLIVLLEFKYKNERIPI